jgi:hypothetical protein
MLNTKRKLNSTLLPEFPLLVVPLVDPDVESLEVSLVEPEVEPLVLMLEAAVNVKVVSFLFPP